MMQVHHRLYCCYCGRVQHRCICHQPNSLLAVFLERGGHVYSPCWMLEPYKRGVPPQVKKRVRAALKRHYSLWYTSLIGQYGEACQNCGVSEPLVLDHIVPVAKGGQSEYSNLQLLCEVCNRLKGKLVFDCRSL